MVEQGRNIGDRGAANADESEGLDMQEVREWSSFILGAPRRRPLLAAVSFVVVAVLGVTVSLTMPLSYVAEVKILAQRNSAIRMLSSPNSQLENVDNPTKNVAAMISRRDNLEALIKDAHLVEQFQKTRPAPLRFKDRVMASMFGPPSPDDMEKAMVYTLDKNLDVFTDEATVKITVEWTNPNIAYELVMLVQKNFLEGH